MSPTPPCINGTINNNRSSIQYNLSAHLTAKTALAVLRVDNSTQYPSRTVKAYSYINSSQLNDLRYNNSLDRYHYNNAAKKEYKREIKDPATQKYERENPCPAWLESHYIRKGGKSVQQQNKSLIVDIHDMGKTISIFYTNKTNNTYDIPIIEDNMLEAYDFFYHHVLPSNYKKNTLRFNIQYDKMPLEKCKDRLGDFGIFITDEGIAQPLARFCSSEFKHSKYNSPNLTQIHENIHFFFAVETNYKSIFRTYNQNISWFLEGLAELGAAYSAPLFMRQLFVDTRKLLDTTNMKHSFTEVKNIMHNTENGEYVIGPVLTYYLYTKSPTIMLDMIKLINKTPSSTVVSDSMLEKIYDSEDFQSWINGHTPSKDDFTRTSPLKAKVKCHLPAPKEYLVLTQGVEQYHAFFCSKEATEEFTKMHPTRKHGAITQDKRCTPTLSKELDRIPENFNKLVVHNKNCTVGHIKGSTIVQNGEEYYTCFGRKYRGFAKDFIKSNSCDHIVQKVKNNCKSEKVSSNKHHKTLKYKSYNQDKDKYDNRHNIADYQFKHDADSFLEKVTGDSPDFNGDFFE